MNQEPRHAVRADLSVSDRVRLPLLTVNELAIHLGFATATTVHRFVKQHRLPFIRVGRRQLFRIDRVIGALEQLGDCNGAAAAESVGEP